MKVLQKVKVKNELGLHSRPASMIAKLLQNSKSKVWFTADGQTINARSIMSVLLLAAGKGTSILITVEGEDSQKTMEQLIEAFESQFGETAT